MFLAVTTVGFILMTLGVAMLLVGEVPFLGKRIPSRHSRLMGSIFVLFLPLAFGVNLASSALFGSDAVQGPVVTWTLFALCVLVSLVILIHALARKEQSGAKTATPMKKNPFGEIEAEEEVEEVVLLEPEPAERPASKKATAKRRPPPAQERDPFDFS
jgi:hypothetical protein